MVGERGTRIGTGGGMTSPFSFRLLERLDRLGHRFGLGGNRLFRKHVCDPMDAALLAEFPDDVRPPWTPESRRLANKNLLTAFLAVWDQCPDHRFGQFVMNLSRTDEGFADTWNWSHAEWHRRLEEAARTWAT